MTPPVRFETKEGKTFYIFPEHVMAVADGTDDNDSPSAQIVLVGSLTYRYRDTAANVMRKLMGMA